MTDQLFDTKEKREVAVANFKSLMITPGWLFLKEIVDANIKILTEQILIGGDEKIINLKRRDLIAYKNVINTPYKKIEECTVEKSPKPSFDPYEQVDISK